MTDFTYRECWHDLLLALREEILLPLHETHPCNACVGTGRHLRGKAMLIHVRGAETHSLHLGQTLVTSLTGVEDHENDGRADRLVDQHLRHDRFHRGPDEAAVQPLVPEGVRV